MKAAELKKWISDMTQDIDFLYKGIGGSICPFREDCIALCYGDYTYDATSIDEAMNAPLIEGKSLNEMAELLDI